LHRLEAAGADYVIVGCIALLQHVPGRNTSVLDLIVSLTTLQKIPEFVVNEETSLFATGRFHDLRVDILKIEHAFFAMIRRLYSRSMPYDVGSLPTIAIDG
jgi:hypothetical protein